LAVVEYDGVRRNRRHESPWPLKETNRWWVSMPDRLPGTWDRRAGRAQSCPWPH
jgi:hypothetical protein